MNAKKTDLKELEGWYAKSGNQLMLLYGGMDCRKEQLIKEFCVEKSILLSMQTAFRTGTDSRKWEKKFKMTF